MSLQSLTIRLKERHAEKVEMKRRHSTFKEAIASAGPDADADTLAGFKFPPGFVAKEKGEDVIQSPSTAVKNINAQSNSLWALILAVFPDICPDYVERKYRELRKRIGKLPDDERLVDAILEAGPYPSLQERKRRKVDATASVEKKGKWRIDDGVQRDKQYFDSARALLRLDFPDVPAEYLRILLKSYGTLFSTYLELHHIDAKYDTIEPRPYFRLRSAKRGNGRMPPFDNIIIPQAHRNVLTAEFQDARNERISKEEKSRDKVKKEQFEADNEAIHAAIGGLMECKCCFSDAPINRMISCNGDVAHFFCATCIKMSVETQIGYMRYEICCMDTSQCKAGFSPTVLANILSSALVKKLDELRQRDEIEKAGIEGLEECPFCDFKAICPPAEEDREFRCMDSKCGKTSCRLCKKESHVPQTCEEASKEKCVPARHQIEEAMTQAIIRICPNPKCKVSMIKDEGCNKLSCSKCLSLICYVCKKNITKEAYRHFSTKPDGCPLYDQDKGINRHFNEAAKAQQEATKEILRANPELKATDLKVELPDKAPPPPRQQDRVVYPPGRGPMMFLNDQGNNQVDNIRRAPANQINGVNNPLPVPVHPGWVLRPRPHVPQDLQEILNEGHIRPIYPQIDAHYYNLMAWGAGPRQAPAVQANIPPQTDHANPIPAGQLRQRLFEEQRFQRNPATGTVPAVPRANANAQRREIRQPANPYPRQLISFGNNVAVDMVHIPPETPLMAQRADPPDAHRHLVPRGGFVFPRYY